MIPCAFLLPPVVFAMSTILTAAQSRFLRGQAHGLKAMLQVGSKGASAALIAEVDGALEQHELIKLRVSAGERGERKALIEQIAADCRAAVVQRIGHVVVLYRPSQDHRRIVLPHAAHA